MYLFVILFYILIQPSDSFLRLENITVTRGQRVRFRCQLPSTLSTQENIIQWKKSTHHNNNNDDDLILSINGKIPKILQKFYQTELTNEWSALELFNVDRIDSTTYICQTFETQTILCQYNLVVLIKPEAPRLTVNEENIQEFQLVTLTCSSFNGNPSPQFTWYRNGTPITSPMMDQVVLVSNRNSSNLTFNITRSDNQVKYECQIWNQALANPLRVEQRLHVKYRPYVNILETSTTEHIHVGMEHIEQYFTCNIDANPLPTSIYWTINGTTIVSREKILYLPRLTSDQSGTYTCVVENAIGKVNQSIYLDVQYAPRVRAIVKHLVVNRTDSAILRCSIDANPLPYQISWFKDERELVRQTVLSDFRIDRVERNDSGLYTCIAWNRLGNMSKNGSTTIELIVQSRPILETTYSKFAAEIGQSIILSCSVSGQPRPDVIWKRDERIFRCENDDNRIEQSHDQCRLRLIKMTNKDFGQYRCVAENLLGKEEWTYTVVSRGKPETPHEIRATAITSSSFKIQFAPAFDGGGGPQHFIIEIFASDTNNSIINQQLPVHTYEYTVTGLNESSVYRFRIKSVNTYGESPWSNETLTQTLESIVTADDLPRLHSFSYNTKENYLQFDYAPGDYRSLTLNDEQICLHIRQSNDGKMYEQIFPTCLSIHHRRIQWTMNRNFPFLKLSICSRKHSHICGAEVEMKQETNDRSSAPMIIGIAVTASFLVLVVLILIILMLCRWQKNKSTSNNTNKFSISGLDKGVKPIISEPRLQNPYLLYSNTNAHLPPYDFANNEYQQRKAHSSFSHSCDTVDREQQPKDELSVHDTCSSYGTATRTATIRASPHWIINNGGGGGGSRSGSNPSSEFSCLTQNTNILLGETHSNHTPTPVSHYGFPTIPSQVAIAKHHILTNGNSTLRSASFDQQQQQSDSGHSTPNRMKKLFYEVVV